MADEYQLAGIAFVEIDGGGNRRLVSLDEATIGGVPYDEKADLTGENGVLLSSQVPDLAITETFAVADEAARLALDVQEGDVAIQSDNNIAYVFTGGDATNDADWSAISVAPVDGRTITPAAIQNQDYSESVEEITAASGTVTLDLSAANVHRVEADGDVTIAFSNTTSTPPGNSVLVYLYDTDGTGPHTVSWPAGTEWPGGTVSDTIESNSDVEIALTSDDGGTTWRASERGAGFQ